MTMNRYTPEHRVTDGFLDLMQFAAAVGVIAGAIWWVIQRVIGGAV